MQAFARDHIAEEIDAIVGLIETGKCTNVIFTIYVGSKGITLHTILHFAYGLYMEIIFQGIDNRNFAIRPFNGFDIAQGTVGTADGHRFICPFNSLRFQNAIAVFFAQAADNDDGVIF